MGLPPAPESGSPVPVDLMEKGNDNSDSNPINDGLEKKTDADNLGYPPKKGPELWMLTPQRFQFALESFRTLKNKMTALKENEDLNVFLITGAADKVGTSMVTFNLGLILSFDLADKRILIVDANMANPSLGVAFDFPAEHPGLMDFLLRGYSLEMIIQKMPSSNLHFITSGKTESNIISPFDLERFRTFINEISKEYDFILIDSAPVLKSSHTRIISSKTHGVIIVVEANKTRWEVISEIKRQLNVNGAKLVGSFLNKRKFVIPKWAYRFI